MPVLTLPDGSTRSFDGPVTGANLAADIGAGLAKAALAITVDGETRDLEYLIETDASVSILTEPRKNTEPDPASLELLRHSTAHVMAEAIQRVIPEAMLVYGPPWPKGSTTTSHFLKNAPFVKATLKPLKKRWPRSLRKTVRLPAMN